MRNYRIAILGTGLLCLIATAGSTLGRQAAQKSATPATAQRPAGAPAQPKLIPVSTRTAPTTNLMPVEARQALVKQYCAGCHSDAAKQGGLTLSKFDLAHPEQNAELAEK